MRNLECLEHTADDYLSVFAAGGIPLPLAEIKAMIVEIVGHYPNVVGMATDPRQATEAFLAIDLRTAPPDLHVGLIVGIINPALSYVRDRCPEIAGAGELPDTADGHLLSWPTGDSGE